MQRKPSPNKKRGERVPCFPFGFPLNCPKGAPTPKRRCFQWGGAFVNSPESGPGAQRLLVILQQLPFEDQLQRQALQIPGSPNGHIWQPTACFQKTQERHKLRRRGSDRRVLNNLLLKVRPSASALLASQGTGHRLPSQRNREVPRNKTGLYMFAPCRRPLTSLAHRTSPSKVSFC